MAGAGTRKRGDNMTRLEEVRHVLAKAQTAAIMADIPVSSPQANEMMAQAICEWMHGLRIVHLTDDEATAFLGGTDAS